MLLILWMFSDLLVPNNYIDNEGENGDTLLAEQHNFLT